MFLRRVFVVILTQKGFQMGIFNLYIFKEKKKKLYLVASPGKAHLRANLCLCLQKALLQWSPHESKGYGMWLVCLINHTAFVWLRLLLCPSHSHVPMILMSFCCLWNGLKRLFPFNLVFVAFLCCLSSCLYCLISLIFNCWLNFLAFLYHLFQTIKETN